MEELLEKMKEYKLVLVLVSLGAVIGGFFVFSRPSQAPQSASSLAQELVAQSASSEKISAKAEPLEKEPVSDFLTVDVKGAVKKPGIYELKMGSRVHDALELAGGMLAEADSKSVNLAQKLTDEAVIYVALQGEEAADVTAQATASPAVGGAEPKSAKVNINTADLAQLQTISGIGQKKAQDILDYRESQGRFQSVDDLKNVSGIGTKSLEKLRDYVTVD